MEGKRCGQGYIPANRTCRVGSPSAEQPSRSSGGGNRLKDLPKNGKGQVQYRGRWWTPNKPVSATQKNKKRQVLATKKVEGETRVKVVSYGHTGYQHNYSRSAKKNYLTRSAGIRNKSGELTKDDPWSANYWARKDLWARNKPADGSARYAIDSAYSTAYQEALR